MHRILIFISILLSSFLFSQKSEFKSDIQIIYNLNFKPDSTQSKIVQDIGVVYIDSNNKRSVYQASKKKKMDSLIQAMDITKFPSRPMYIINHVIYKDFSNSKLSYSEVVDNVNFGYSESIKELNWKVGNEEKEILGFNCKIARLYFRGRNYIAWYCPTIPIQDGPYKFSGLPGLILEIYDVKNNFHYQALAIEKKPVKILFDNTHKEINRNTLFETKISNIEKATRKNIKFNPMELD